MVFVAAVVQSLVPPGIAAVIGPMIGPHRPTTQKMMPAHVPVHRVAPRSHLVGRHPFVQIESIAHAPSGNRAQPRGNVPLQPLIDRAADPADKTSGRLPARMIAPGPDMHHAAGLMCPGDQQLQGFERTRVRIRHRRLDAVAGGIQIEPSSADDRDMETIEAVLHQELLDLAVHQFRLVVKHLSGCRCQRYSPTSPTAGRRPALSLPNPICCRIVVRNPCASVRGFAAMITLPVCPLKSLSSLDVTNDHVPRLVPVKRNAQVFPPRKTFPCVAFRHSLGA